MYTIPTSLNKSRNLFLKKKGFYYFILIKLSYIKEEV